MCPGPVSITAFINSEGKSMTEERNLKPIGYSFSIPLITRFMSRDTMPYESFLSHQAVLCLCFSMPVAFLMCSGTDSHPPVKCLYVLSDLDLNLEE